MTPLEFVKGAADEGDPRRQTALDATLLDDLWRQSEAADCGLDREELKRILVEAGAAQNYGLERGARAGREQQAAFFKGLKLQELVLARACGAGKEQAWEQFLRYYREPLTRAAIAITGSESLGNELADQLYGELFGLTTRDGERRCPLDSYRGRGSLMGWLRTIVAQRHVDHYRRRRREEALDELDMAAPEKEPEKCSAELTVLERAMEAALGSCATEDRLLLATYYLDGRTLLQIAQVLNVHEATVSRKLKRVCEGVREQVLKNLRDGGMSRRGADEVLGADPRDLDLNLKKLLQHSQVEAFKEKAGQ